MSNKVDHLALLDLIESRDADEQAAKLEPKAEAYARAKTVERACLAVGYKPGSCYERLAVVVAKIPGSGFVRRTIAELASDSEINCSHRHVTRAFEQLHQDGVLLIEKEPPPPVRRRGRHAVTYRLSIDWQVVRQAITEFEAWEEESRAIANRKMDRQEEPIDLLTSCRHRGDITPASSGHCVDIKPTSSTHTLYPPNNPVTHGPPSPSELSAIEPIVGRKVDHRKRIVTRSETEPTAIRLCRALNWPTGDVQTLWRVAAAFDCGLLSEWSIKDACKAAVEQATTSRVGYFRKTLAGNCETDLDGLRETLSSVKMPGGFPEKPPDRPRESVRNNIRHQPCPVKQHNEAIAALARSLRMENFENQTTMAEGARNYETS